MYEATRCLRGFTKPLYRGMLCKGTIKRGLHTHIHTHISTYQSFPTDVRGGVVCKGPRIFKGLHEAPIKKRLHEAHKNFGGLYKATI